MRVTVHRRKLIYLLCLMSIVLVAAMYISRRGSNEVNTKVYSGHRDLIFHKQLNDNRDSDREAIDITHVTKTKKPADRQVAKTSDNDKIRETSLIDKPGKHYIADRLQAKKFVDELEGKKYIDKLKASGNSAYQDKNRNTGSENWTERRNEPPPLNVYVFEEHHEALHYWFDAANKGLVPKTGNVLVHFDGHADMQPPILLSGYPFFKWPRQDQIRLLMQRNDAFIQSAIIAGLISRVIWVWPRWDGMNHAEKYQSLILKIGWTKVKAEDSSDQQVFHCECWKDINIEDCHYYDLDFKEISIARNQCNIMRDAHVEFVNEMYVVTFLKENDWLIENDSVILDIDEDFYGCSLVIKPLLDLGVTMDAVTTIDEIVDAIFCPQTTAHAAEANHILLRVVSLIKLQKFCRVDNLSSCKGPELKLEPQLIFSNLLKDALNKNLTNMCQRGGKSAHATEEYILDFVQEISKLTVHQLSKLGEIGFCSSETPKSFHLIPPKFRLCYGYNTPENSIVTEFDPTQDNVRKRSLRLNLILRNMKHCRPKVVSLCRSVRDGYTPRYHFNRIEHDILTAVNTSFKNIKVHYDEDLLGGKDGWPEK